LFDLRRQLEELEWPRCATTFADTPDNAVAFHRVHLRSDGASGEAELRSDIAGGQSSASKESDDAAARGVH
jgi:hypothetical protein